MSTRVLVQDDHFDIAHASPDSGRHAISRTEQVKLPARPIDLEIANVDLIKELGENGLAQDNLAFFGVDRQAER